MKRKVCYILPEYKKDDATHFSYLGRLLKEASKEMDIFLIILKGESPKEDFGCSRTEVINSSNFFTLNIKLRYWILYARFHEYRDFYVHYSFLAAFSASICTKIFGGRVFYWNCGEPWKFRRSFLREHFERLVYKNINFLVTGAVSLGEEYSKHYPISAEKIKVMPNWIDMERFKEVPDKNALKKELDLPSDKKIIFFAHRLSSRKGAKWGALPVISQVLQKTNNALFVIAGTGPDEKMLQSRIVRMPLLERGVMLLGAVPNNVIQKYYAVSDVFFMPSQEEGFPRAMLEAMASGVPVVASDVGAVLSLLPSSCRSFVVPPNDTDGFSRAILALLSEEKWKLLDLEKDLRARASEFDTPIVAKIFVKLFE